MFFSSAMSALKKHQEEEEDSEEEDVFQHCKQNLVFFYLLSRLSFNGLLTLQWQWIAREVVAAKTYSMETAVRYVYGQGFGMDVQILTDEEKEAIERARYCRQQLLRLKARRAAQEAGEADTSQILQQEEVEEWLANIELRLRQQSRQLGIPAAEFPIWIAPLIQSKSSRGRKIGNIASAATAAAAAIRLVTFVLYAHMIDSNGTNALDRAMTTLFMYVVYCGRLKLTSGELTSGRGSPSIGATPIPEEKAAAIAALTDLMEELEELGVRIHFEIFTTL